MNGTFGRKIDITRIYIKIVPKNFTVTSLAYFAFSQPESFLYPGDAMSNLMKGRDSQRDKVSSYPLKSDTKWKEV